MSISFGIIYRVLNKVTMRYYIGQTITLLEKRKCNHINEAIAHKGNSYFHRSLLKHGKDAFEWKIIEYCDSKEEMDEMEFHYIKQYDSFDNGYNLTLGGGGSVGYKMSKEVLKKLSNIHSNMWEITFPDGHKEIIKNLIKFCKINNLDNSRMISVSKGRINHTKQYRCKNLSKINVESKRIKKHTQKVLDKLSDDKAHMWEIIFPDGHKEIIKNLTSFCKKNGLNTSGMCGVSKGRLKHYKFFKCKNLTSGNVKKKKQVANKQSKYQSDTWEITFPDGHKEVITSLISFCKGKNLKIGNMYNTAKRKSGTYKGYACKNLTAYRLKYKNKTDEMFKRASKAHAHDWEIMFPNGNIEKINNLAKFCKENNLNRGHMCGVSKGRGKTHKGFKCKNLTKN